MFEILVSDVCKSFRKIEAVQDIEIAYQGFEASEDGSS